MNGSVLGVHESVICFSSASMLILRGVAGTSFGVAAETGDERALSFPSRAWLVTA